MAVYEQNAARRAERLAALQAEEEYRAEEPADDYDDNFDEEDVPGGIPVPGWLSSVFSWGHKVTKEMEGEAEPASVDDSLGYEPPAPVEPELAPAEACPAFEPVKVTSNHPRRRLILILGRIPVSEGGSEPIEPIIIGPGDASAGPAPKGPARAIVKPVVPDAVETAAEDFFAPAGSPAPAPVVPTVPPAAPEEPPHLPTTDEPVVPVRVSAENAVAMRSEPDEDGWISITSEPVEEKDLNTLVAAAMEKPAAGEQAAATAPAEEPEVVETFSTSIRPSSCLKNLPRRVRPRCAGRAESQRPEAGGYAGKLRRAHPGAGYLPGPLRYPVRGAAHGGCQDQPHHLAGR